MNPAKKLLASGTEEWRDDDSVSMLLVVKVIEATLTKNFESFGCLMDPLATVRWLSPNGAKTVIGQTPVDWNAHMHPHWNYTCQGRIVSMDTESQDSVEIEVFEADMFSKSTECGMAMLSVVQLLEAKGTQFSAALKLRGEDTGSVLLACELVPEHEKEGPRRFTSVEPDLFETRAPRISIHGGTASFYMLKLLHPKAGRSEFCYIGKDIWHATDEVMFYEEACRIRAERHGSDDGLRALLDFGLEYKGVLSCIEAAPFAASWNSRCCTLPRTKTGDLLELMVLGNLAEGCKRIRLVDVKIGSRTAAGGWKSKSYFSAMRQNVLDGLTNSATQGFRIEGFTGEPRSLSSWVPLLDIEHVAGRSSEYLNKKAKKMLLQRMPAEEMFAHFLSLSNDVPAQEDSLGASEFAELIFHETLSRLCRLALDCRRVAVPQKWIGSSVALAYDAGQLPLRSTSELVVRSMAKVVIFDWGRSELNTLQQHMSLSAKEQTDRRMFWQHYVEGIDRLSWEAARAYRNQFGNPDGWKQVKITIFDWDSQTENDFVASVVVDVETTSPVEIAMRDKAGKPVASVKLTYAMEWKPCPPGSRLKGTWCVHVEKVTRVPLKDVLLLKFSSDPVIEIDACGMDSTYCFRQYSSVKPRTCEPVWNETFELPVAQSSFLEAALVNAGMAKSILSSTSHELLLPPGSAAFSNGRWAPTPATSSTSRSEIRSRDAACVEHWVNLLEESHTVSAAQPRHNDGDNRTNKGTAQEPDEKLKALRTPLSPGNWKYLPEVLEAKSPAPGLTQSDQQEATERSCCWLGCY